MREEGAWAVTPPRFSSGTVLRQRKLEAGLGGVLPGVGSSTQNERPQGDMVIRLSRRGTKALYYPNALVWTLESTVGPNGGSVPGLAERTSPSGAAMLSRGDQWRPGAAPVLVDGETRLDGEYSVQPGNVSTSRVAVG